ncbi:MAG TPA: CHAT domain-containing protein [Planctomycetota bacterium]|nr:CHAT domain-containing protein [Planctomycetota bacterium]
MPGNEPKFTLQVLLQSADSIRVTPFKEGSALESTIKTSRTCPFHSALVADRAREVLGLLARANAGTPGLLPQLVQAGQAIYLDLLPGFLKEKLQEVTARNLVLHLDRPLLGIPWELLHDGDQFLGRRFRIGRLVSEQEGGVSLQRAMQAPLAVLIVADPTGDRPGARREAEELGALLEGISPFGRVTMLVGDVSLRTVRDELGRHDILHFAGHAEGGGAGGAGGLRLRDGELTASLLDQLRGRVDFPGLVFLNGCTSSDEAQRFAAGAGPTAAGLAGVASALLLGGSRHVIGTLWEVRDEVARICAAAVYRRLAAGDTIGAAQAAAREAISAAHGEESLFWAAHVLYGDPTWRVVAPANAEFEDFDVLDGLQAKYQRELLASDPATRLLAAAMLLRLGDRSVVPALGRDLPELLTWLSPSAPVRTQRRAALVVQALAAAAGLQPSGPPDALPDEAAVRALVKRLVEG